jgi:hypothetical protein
MKNNYLLILFSQFFIPIAQASTAPQIPTDLMYLNKPIDSLCFFSQEAAGNDIDLKKCGANKNKLTIKSMNSDLSKQGYLGYDYEDKQVTPGSQGTSYYKYYPAGNNKYWVYSINNSGGTGQFTAIDWVTRKDQNTLALNSIAGGDRCNGGIQDVSEKSNRLTYSVNLTASDLIALADKSITLKPYDDLAACAVCCTAKSFYTVTENAKPALDYVELNKVSDVSEMSEQGTLAACFNTFYVSYSKLHSTKLTHEQLLAFVNQFKQACMK